VTTTFLSFPTLSRLDLDRRRLHAAVQRTAARLLETSARSARGAARTVDGYWNSPLHGEDVKPKVVDVLVLQMAAVCAGGAFLLGMKLAPGAEGMLFVLYALGLVALCALGFEVMLRLAREGRQEREETVPTVALAARAPGRGRRAVRARMRWLRRLVGRTLSAPSRHSGAMRPTIA